MARLRSSTAIIKATKAAAEDLSPLPTIPENDEIWMDISLSTTPVPQYLITDFTSRGLDRSQYDTSKTSGEIQSSLRHEYRAIGSYDLEAQAPIVKTVSIKGVVSKGFLLGRKCWDSVLWLFDGEGDVVKGHNGSWWV